MEWLQWSGYGRRIVDFRSAVAVTWTSSLRRGIGSKAGRETRARPSAIAWRVEHGGLRRGALAYAAGAWDVRRFRPNIPIELEGEGWLEDAWAERGLRAGTAQLVPGRRCVRCTMINRAQPGLDRDVNIYKTLNRIHGGDAGMVPPAYRRAQHDQRPLEMIMNARNGELRKTIKTRRAPGGRAAHLRSMK